MQGANRLLRDLGEAYKQSSVRIVHAPCVGACDKAPVAVVGQCQITSASIEKMENAIESGKTQPDTPNYKSYDPYVSEGGYQVWQSCVKGNHLRSENLSIIEDSELRGLGGAGFPTRTTTAKPGAPRKF